MAEAFTSRRSFGSILTASILASMTASCAPDAGTPKEAVISEKDLNIIFHNSSTFLFFDQNTKSTQPKKLIQFYWSPSCRDSMRFFRYTIQPAMMTPHFNNSNAILFNLLPRHQHDLDLATMLRQYDQRDYSTLMLSHLVYGAKEDRYLTKADSAMIIEKLNPRTDASSLYEKTTARACLEAVNLVLSKKVYQMNTPILIVDGAITSLDDAVEVINARIAG